jgi:large subunit ribosomal protein L1
MAHIGKRVVKGREGIDRTKLYPLSDAVAFVKERAKPSSTRPSKSR